MNGPIICAARGCDTDITQAAEAAKTKPPKYCQDPGCKRARSRERKRLERAQAYNTLTRVFPADLALEVPERGKRKTSSPRDEEGEMEWNKPGGGTMRYARAKRRTGTAPAPIFTSSIHRSAGTPVGSVKRPDYIRGDEDHMTFREGTGAPGCPGSPADAGTCLGETWLERPDDADLLEKTKAVSHRLRDRYDRLPENYLMGGHLWGGMGVSRAAKALPRNDRTPAELLAWSLEKPGRPKVRIDSESIIRCADGLGIPCDEDLARRLVLRYGNAAAACEALKRIAKATLARKPIGTVIDLEAAPNESGELEEAA